MAVGFDRSDDARRVGRRRMRLTGCLAILFLSVAVILAGWLVVSRIQSNHDQQRTVEQANQALAQLNDRQMGQTIADARSYNQKLFASGQADLAVVQDPLIAVRLSGALGAAITGGASVDGRTNAELIADDQHAHASDDPEYDNLLNVGDGVMGTLTIPALESTMPIYHGTSNEALSSGAGHLYGTSLPVGGENSHSVLTAHRGLLSADLFTRLDEMQTGDAFYIDVFGTRLTYQVDRIAVINPDDVSQLTAAPGEDRVTLMTCTPYGVNTQRLLVSAIRVNGTGSQTGVPLRAGGAWRWTVGAVILAISLGLMYLMLSRLPSRPDVRHDSGSRHFA